MQDTVKNPRVRLGREEEKIYTGIEESGRMGLNRGIEFYPRWGRRRGEENYTKEGSQVYFCNVVIRISS